MAITTVGLGTHISNNHFKSVLLLAGFPLLLLLMTGSFFAGINVLSQNSSNGYRAQNGEIAIDWGYAFDAGLNSVEQYGIYVFAAALIWFVIAFFFHTQILRAATGAVPVTRKQMPRIYNMLENLCISRGIPMPAFEVIDSPALNAFASGISNKTYKIVLTRGLIEKLEDDELESVIAHELTHILNRDVRLLMVSVIFVGIISFLAEIIFRNLVYGRRAHYARSRSKNSNDKSGVVIMLLALAILVIGWLLALLIRFALSRRREYLADAGSVDLTRNPEAMMRALMRISGKDRVAGLPDEVQQMCIENSHNFMGIFATHPAIEDRIRAISDTTGTPVPVLSVSLRRSPKSPWEKGKSQ